MSTFCADFWILPSVKTYELADLSKSECLARLNFATLTRAGCFVPVPIAVTAFVPFAVVVTLAQTVALVPSVAFVELVHDEFAPDVLSTLTWGTVGMSSESDWSAS
jgi:hypothetical protein